MDFFLTSKSLKEVKESGIESDFEIIIFDDKISFSKFVASFLSPKISKIIRSDLTFSQILLDFPNKSIFYTNQDELKNMISHVNFILCLKKFLEGEPIHINCESDSSKNITAKLLIEFGMIFDNSEFIEYGRKILKLSEDTTKLSSTNIFDIIKLNHQLNHCQNSQKTIQFLASNFYSLFERINVQELTKDELEAIFSSPELKIESEDSLFEFIYSKGPEFFFLFDYVEIQYLSIKNVQLLIDSINNYELSLHRPLWSSICRRLLLDPSEDNSPENPRSIQKENKPLNCENGIFEYLRNESNGNPCAKCVINIETTDVNCGSKQNLFDKSQKTEFRLDNKSNGFILIDFKDKQVSFSKYYFSVPVQENGNYTGRPKSWMIEGSNDKNSWDLIDRKENITSLKDWGNSSSFSCSNVSNKFYRFIRINEIINHQDNHYFLLSEIEFYGSIMKK